VEYACDEGRFRALTWIISYCITIVASGALYVVLKRENKRRDALVGNEDERDRLAFMDMTDKENVYFRYVL
jgi:hypothetical protein